MTRKTAKEMNKPAGVASADLEENGVPVSEKGAENFSATSSKQRGEMAAPVDTNAKPTSAAGRATNGASVSNEVADSRDSRLDRLERSLDKVIAFLSETHVDDESDPSDWSGEGQDGDCQDGVALADPPREGADAMEDGELAEPPPKKPKQSTLFADIARDLKLEELPAPSLSEDLATMVRKCACEKPSEEAAKLLQDKAAELAVPRVEDLVWDQLDMQTRTRDAALQGLQQSLLRGLTAVAQAMDAIVAIDEERHFESEVRTLSDAIRFIGATNVDLCIKRRELIKPALNSEFKRICSATAPITDNLFGDNLPQQVKDIVEMNRLKHKLAPSVRAPPRTGAGRGVSPRGWGSFRDFRGSWRGGRGLARLPRFAGNYGFSRPSQDYWNQKSSFASTSKNGESVHQRNKNSKALIRWALTKQRQLAALMFVNKRSVSLNFR